MASPALSTPVLHRRPVKDVFRALTQAVALSLTFAAINWACAVSGHPSYSAPLGFALVLAALLSGWLPVRAVEHGARWLIAQSTIFLIPAIVAIAPAWPRISAEWLPLATVIIGGTVLSAALTAIAVEVICKWMMRRAV